MMRHLQAIMNISWKDKITNIEVLKRAGLPSMENMLIQMNLRWLGHVERMDHQSLPRQILYSQLCQGKCNLARPRLTFKATVKRNLEKLDIERSSWQQEAKDRAAWRNRISPKCHSHPRQAAMMMIMMYGAFIVRVASMLCTEASGFISMTILHRFNLAQ